MRLLLIPFQCPYVANEDLQSLVSRLVSEVRCKELIAIDSLAAEKTCTLFRRWASLLDKLTFASAEERETVLTELQEKGMTRVRAHKESDNHKERARQIVELGAPYLPTIALPNTPKWRRYDPPSSNVYTARPKL